MDNYENLLNLAHDGIMVLDLSNSAILFWNRGAVELYGWTRESMSPSVPRGSPCSLLLTIDEACSRTNAAQASSISSHALPRRTTTSVNASTFMRDKVPSISSSKLRNT